MAPEGLDWLHEIKYDGYRLLAYLDQTKVRLITRGLQDWTHKFPDLERQLAQLPVDQAVIDGEIVVLDQQGRSSFQGLQNFCSHQGGVVTFYAFDLLCFQQRDLRPLPLLQRKQILQGLLEGSEVRYSQHVIGSGSQVLDGACELGCEGIISKRIDSTYQGRRSKSWLKVKCLRSEEFVVVGYSRPQGSRQGFGALLLAQGRGEKMRYCGKVGTGFSDKTLEQLMGWLEPLRCQNCPLSATPPGARGVTWVEPRIKALVKFGDRTEEGLLRHSSYQKGWLETRIKVTHPERVIDPSSGLTKADLLAYYERVAEHLLPHIQNRPLTILRCPQGIDHKGFYQKHLPAGQTAFVKAVDVGEPEDYLWVDSLDGLLSLIQNGSVELHPWGSRNDDLAHPDRLIFDLDPDAGLGWSEVRAASLEVRDRLQALGLQSFCKTTGGKGLHVVVPLQPLVDWEIAKAFSKRLVEIMARESPSAYTTNLLKVKRKNRIFLDYLRNGRGATAVAAYSARARVGLPVSMPISWENSSPTTVFASQDPGAEPAWQDFFQIRQSLTQTVLQAVGL